MSVNKEKLPSSWETIPLEDVVNVNPKIDKSIFDNELPVSFVPMPAVEAETGNINISEIKTFESVKKGYTAFQEHDVLFAKITPCMENGKMAVVPKLINGLGFGSTEFHVLRSYSGVSPQYIYYYVSSKTFRVDSAHNMTGAVGQRRVPATWLGRVNIPLPSIKEQHRIVAKIEELFSELDKGIESLKTAREQLKVYRQALLKDAFEGKFTEQWRKDNTDKLESADDLLARIHQERETRYQQQLDVWKAAVKQWDDKGKEGKKPAKPTSLIPLKSIDSDKADSLPALPKGWVWTYFENLIEYVTSGSRGWAKYYAESGATFIRAQNLKYDRLDLGDVAFVALPGTVEGKRTLTKKGDLLITITGANVTKTAYVKNDIGEAYVSQHVALCRLVNSNIANYLFMFLVAGVAGRKQLENVAYGAGKPGLNLENIKKLLVPIPSTDECVIIAESFEKNSSIFDQLDNTLSEQVLKSQTLRQSILKKAFSGQLVPQDQNDEPASILLERIKTEKVEQDKQAKARKTTKRRLKA